MGSVSVGAGSWSFSKGAMKRNPVFPKNENVDFSELGYDPQEDFIQFLEEARRYAAAKAKARPHGTTNYDVSETTERSRLTPWKDILVFWRRCTKNKKSESAESESATAAAAPSAGAALPRPATNAKRRLVSGPVFESSRARSRMGCSAGGGSGGGSFFFRCTSSGHVSDCLIPRRSEQEKPYVRLRQQRNSQLFGPIYQV